MECRLYAKLRQRVGVSLPATGNLVLVMIKSNTVLTSGAREIENTDGQHPPLVASMFCQSSGHTQSCCTLQIRVDLANNFILARPPPRTISSRYFFIRRQIHQRAARKYGQILHPAKLWKREKREKRRQQRNSSWYWSNYLNGKQVNNRSQDRSGSS